jgi:Tat protein translocase TatB subunit
MMGLGFGEIVLLSVLALILIGPKKLPELAQKLGQFFRQIQSVKDQFINEIHQEKKPDTIDTSQISNTPQSSEDKKEK